jgi:hypothetical protein
MNVNPDLSDVPAGKVASAATRALLDERGWKVTELAKWLDRRVPAVSLFVAGRFDHPPTRMIDSVCKVFGVSRAEFWTLGEQLVAARLTRPVKPPGQLPN